jgi:hypothetical protein
MKGYIIAECYGVSGSVTEVQLTTTTLLVRDHHV